MNPAPLLLFSLVVVAAPSGPRRYSQLAIKDMEELAPVLRSQVAEIRIELFPDGPIIGEEERIGYGVPWGERRVVLLAPLLDRAKKVWIKGPKGELPAQVILMDPVRRVAILETKVPLLQVGLRNVPVREKRERKVDDEVFALVSTAQESGVVYGVITQDGTDPEYEGHPRIDLKLDSGMPVFDDTARFVGYSRVVAFDQDRFMLITPEMIRGAQTATASAFRKPAPEDGKKRPWWAR
ncbi:MAG: hypothetical protein IPG45_03535 [Deltaproteobacteria bacterium]|nr:hypothetical protein [Deltaproteobacteria bacterium]